MKKKIKPKKLTRQEQADFLFYSAFAVPIALIAFILSFLERFLK